MKQHIYLILIGLFLLLMLIFPLQTFEGTSKGLVLWFQTLLPTLLPFMIISNLLIQTNGIYYFSKLLTPILRRLFCVSPEGSYAVFVGFLCGCPMGAKVVADLISQKRITLKEGQYLLSFCNNVSPMFLIGYVINTVIQKQELLLPTILIMFLSPVLCSILFRYKYHISANQLNTYPLSNSNAKLPFDILDSSIMNGFENITKIGGYIILFSILFSLGEKLPFKHILPILEITNGLPLLYEFPFSFEIQYILSLSLLSFGGICTVAQVRSLIQHTELSILSYTKEKLITAMVTSFITCIYVLLILR